MAAATTSESEKGEPKAKSAKPVRVPKIEEKVILLSKIEVDYEWNCRLKVRTCSEGTMRSESDDGDPDAPGVEGIAGSMEAQGQEVPVDVYPHPQVGEPNCKFEYKLITGFRRSSGAHWLHEHGRTIAGLEQGYVRARVHGVLTELEARRMNIGENVVRENLTTPDLAYAVKMLLKADPGLSAEQLSVLYAKSKNHMAAVVKVAKKVRDGTFNQWRESPVKPLPIIEMVGVADKAKSEQEEDYKERLAAYHGEEGGGTKDAKVWIKNACKKAQDIGRILGTAQRKGILEYDASLALNDPDTQLIRVFVKFKKKIGKKPISDKTVDRINDAFANAFIAARDKEEEEIEGDEIEVIDE